MKELLLQKYKNLKILYIAPTESKRTGVADYATKFKKLIEKHCKNFEINIIMESPFYFQIDNSILNILRIRKEVYSLKKDYNLIHAEMSSSSWPEFWCLYFCIKKFRSLPVILTVHDSPYLCLNPFHIFFPKNYKNYLPLILIRKFLDILIGYNIEKKIVKTAKFIFVTTKIGLRKFKQRVKINYIDYLPHISFPNNTKHNSALNQSKNWILHFGFINESKGLDILIDAMYKLLTCHSEFYHDVRLIICGKFGSDKYRKKINSIIPPEISGNIEFTGYVEEDQLKYFLNEVVCSVFPYREKKIISSSGALLRTLSSGCPVVVSDIPMLTEYVKDGYNGLIFRKNDSEDLYLKLLILIKDERLRDTLSQNALHYINQCHNNHQIAIKVIKKYLEVIQ